MVIQTSLIIVIDCLYKKSPQKTSQVAWDLGVVVAKARAWQLWWPKPTPDNCGGQSPRLTIVVAKAHAWQLWWPKPTPDNCGGQSPRLTVVVAKAHAWQFDHRFSESLRYVSSMDRRPILLQPATSFIFFQQNNELSQKSLIMFALIVYSVIVGPTLRFIVTVHRTPLFANAVEFHAVYVGFQRPILCCFGCQFIHSCGPMLLLWQTNYPKYKNLHARHDATEDSGFLQLITALEPLAPVWIATC